MEEIRFYCHLIITLNTNERRRPRHILMIMATKVDFSHLVLVQTESLTVKVYLWVGG